MSKNSKRANSSSPESSVEKYQPSNSKKSSPSSYSNSKENSPSSYSNSKESKKSGYSDCR